MNTKVIAAVSSSMGGALLGALTGYLIDKGTGAGYGAAIGGVASGVVGYAVADQATTPVAPTGAGALPRSHRVSVNSQLMPRRAA